MTHDLYQTHPSFGNLPGLTNPFGSPYTPWQASGLNPAAYNPMAAQQGIMGQPGGQPLGPQGYVGGISPHHLQLASALAAQTAQVFGSSPFANAIQNPFMNTGYQHPAQALQNPWIAAALQNQLIQHQLLAAAQQSALLNQLYNQGQPASGQQLQANPQIGYAGPAFAQQGFGQQGFGQQQGNPFSQSNNPYSQAGLAPQSWVGQSWVGQGQGQAGPYGASQGQIHPLLLQSIARAFQPNQGVSPWGTF